MPTTVPGTANTNTNVPTAGHQVGSVPRGDDAMQWSSMRMVTALRASRYHTLGGGDDECRVTGRLHRPAALAVKLTEWYPLGMPRNATGSVNWTALTALAASLTALVALATAVMIFRQMRTDTQRILFNTALDSIWRFDTQWNGDDMADARSAAAASLLNGQPGRDVDVVLDFFDQIALLANRQALDDEMVWYQFYWPMANYWRASQSYVHDVARDDPLRWEQLGIVMPRLVAIEARRRKRSLEDAVPTAAQVKDFLASESEAGECEEDDDAEARKMPL